MGIFLSFYGILISAEATEFVYIFQFGKNIIILLVYLYFWMKYIIKSMNGIFFLQITNLDFEEKTQ